MKLLTVLLLAGGGYYVYEKNKNPAWSPFTRLFAHPADKLVALEKVKVTSVPTPALTVALDPGMSTDQVKQVNTSLSSETDHNAIAAHAEALDALGHSNSAKALAAKASAVSEAKAMGADDAEIHLKQVEAAAADPVGGAVATGWYPGYGGYGMDGWGGYGGYGMDGWGGGFGYPMPFFAGYSDGYKPGDKFNQYRPTPGHGQTNHRPGRPGQRGQPVQHGQYGRPGGVHYRPGARPGMGPQHYGQQYRHPGYGQQGYGDYGQEHHRHHRWQQEQMRQGYGAEQQGYGGGDDDDGDDQGLDAAEQERLAHPQGQRRYHGSYEQHGQHAQHPDEIARLEREMHALQHQIATMPAAGRYAQPLGAPGETVAVPDATATATDALAVEPDHTADVEAVTKGWFPEAFGYGPYVDNSGFGGYGSIGYGGPGGLGGYGSWGSFGGWGHGL